MIACPSKSYPRGVKWATSSVYTSPLVIQKSTGIEEIDAEFVQFRSHGQERRVGDGNEDKEDAPTRCGAVKLARRFIPLRMRYLRDRLGAQPELGGRGECV
jgi:hypothetical protein